jgi:hypothetical protein
VKYRFVKYTVPLIVAATALRAQVIRGRVIDAATATGLDGATMSVLGHPQQVTSDDSGKFVLRLYKEGMVLLTARRSGYANGSWSFVLMTNDTADVVLPMRVVPALDTVRVTSHAAPLPRFADFERRRAQQNGGTFITRADIESSAPIQTADLFRRTASVEVRTKGLRRLSRRAVLVSAARGASCPWAGTDWCSDRSSASTRFPRSRFTASRFMPALPPFQWSTEARSQMGRAD